MATGSSNFHDLVVSSTTHSRFVLDNYPWALRQWELRLKYSATYYPQLALTIQSHHPLPFTCL